MTTPRKQTAQTQTQLPTQRQTQRQVSYCQQTMQMQPQTPSLTRFPIDAGAGADVGVGSGICSTFANTKYNRCMHTSAQPPLTTTASNFSRSITALPTSDNFGSYTTLLMDHHPQQQQQQHHQLHHHHHHQQQPQSQHQLQHATQAHHHHHQQQQQQQHQHHQLQSASSSTRTPLCSHHCNYASQSQRWYPPPLHPTTTTTPHTNTVNGCCYLYNTHATSNMPAGSAAAAAATATAPPQLCVCDNWYQQRVPLTHTPHAYVGKSLANGCYYGYEHASHLTDEEDSAFPALADREFHLLHRNIPALRRTGIDTTRIRQYFYPDGGWGWIICGVSFLIHILTTGLQLSYGLLLYYAVQHLHNTSGIELLGALSWSISMLATPFVVSLCRKRSIRLLAIVGGLVLPLGILFTSFATEFGQVVFSYGIVFGIGVAMVREASTVMLGNYFKRRRQFVEMVAMSGEGVGIALFSVVLKEGVGKAGWRLGLQLVAALTAISFFMGLMYRPASLYHPQRRAIQHLKNQRKKLREKKPIINPTEEQSVKYFFLDISSLKSVTVKILLMTSGVAAFGIYTPMFLMALNAAKEGSDVQELVLLQTFLGISMALGVVLAGALLRRTFTIRHFVINTKIISQIFIALVSLAILFLSFIMGYKSLCILSWFYGIGLGGFQYSLKILALERVKLKHFSKAWGFIRGVESVPVLISVPLTSFLNDYSLKYGRAGYYICSAAAAISGIIIFFINEPHNNNNNNTSAPNAQHQQTPHHHQQGNGFMPLMRHASARQHRPQHIRSTAAAGLPIDYPYCDYTVAPDLLLNRSCISLNQVEFEQSAPFYNSRLATSRRAGLYGGPQQPLPHFEAEPERAHYNVGQGSIGARMGKRLQKSLSFIQQQNCCDGQLYSCSCHGSYQLAGGAASVGYKPSSRSTDTQPLICTCSPSSYAQSSRSRSVPEGLSNISQQCNCEQRPMMTAATSREYIYVPQSGAISGGFSSLPRTPRHNQGCARDLRQSQPQCRLKRSQSLCRPVHYVEQITTSV